MNGNGVRACLITNPRSGRGGIDPSEAIAVLRAHGWDVTVRQKLHGGDATKLAREAAQQGYTVVVDCGGDGTLNEIVEGVAGTNVTVGTIPGGTANLWAHELGISHRPEVAALQLIGAEQRRVDVGRVAVNGHHKRHFLLVAGLGFDAAVLRQLSKPLKNRIGRLAYAPAALRALRTYRPMPLDADMDGMRWHGRAAQVVIANTRRYGGFTRISPWAYIDDGLLDVCLLTPAHALSATRQLGALLIRQRPSPDSAQLYRAASITVRCPIVLPLEVDGGSIHLGDDDLTAEGVAYTFSLTAQGVSVLVPRSYDGGLFQPRRLADTLAGIPMRHVAMPLLDRTANRENGHKGNKADKSRIGHQVDRGDNGHPGDNGRDAAKTKSWNLKVLVVGADSLTTARMKDGRVVQVAIDLDTVLRDSAGATRPLWGNLASLVAGDLVRVKGVKDTTRSVFRAQRVALKGRALAQLAPPRGRAQRPRQDSPRPTRLS